MGQYEVLEFLKRKYPKSFTIIDNNDAVKVYDEITDILQNNKQPVWMLIGILECLKTDLVESLLYPEEDD